MNYTINQLQVFLKVVRTQSVTKASEELHLSQPAVSIQLRNFQAQFSEPLTEIIGKRLHVTDFGKAIALRAEGIINQMEEISTLARGEKGILSGKLKLSIVSTGKYVMPFFIADFMRQHAGIELNMDVTNKAKVIDSLQRNEVDLSLVSILPEHLPVHKLDILENKLYLVGSSINQKNKGESVKEYIRRMPFIFREEGSGTRQMCERYLSKHKLPVVKKIILTSNEAVKQAVIAGLGISVMPLIGIRSELKRKELKIIEVAGLPLKTNWQLIWLKSKKLSPISLALLEYIKENKQKIINHHFETGD